MSVIRESVDVDRIRGLDDDGYRLLATTWHEQDCLILTAPTDRGLVYGTFDLLRRMSRREPIDELDVVEEPANDVRMAQQWDEPFCGAIERGYGGRTIFEFEELPDLRERYHDYARLLASIGVNGITVNNVNTTRPDHRGMNDFIDEVEGYRLIGTEYLDRLAPLAAVFRRYGIKLYLSVNFASPILFGDLDTADPLEPTVQEWWERKADEIYERIPDFGGFLVKADSEGQPGPHEYDRDQAEGANVLAEALAPYGGRVFWRAFVYWSHGDRAPQAYRTFAPLDGEFADNVTLQIKNGPIDFQPREPVSTLFGVMDETDVAIELQVTQEYSGQGVHCCFLPPQNEEYLSFDTLAHGEGTPVHSLFEGEGEGVTGVVNVGDDPNWMGHYLSQGNLYGWGRQMWDPTIDSRTIAHEWVDLTFDVEEETRTTIVDLLMDSWPALIDYTTGGLGLIHMMYNGSDELENHYDPNPEEWPQYTGVDENGIGVDRTASGNGYAEQYGDPIAEEFSDPERCPSDLLLFFHHLPWDYELADGTTLIQRMYDNLYAGVEEATRLRNTWAGLEGEIDEARFRHVMERFDDQVEHAAEWRDEIAAFFFDYSGIPDEKGRVPTE